MEKRGRKREKKGRFVIALAVDLAEQIKKYAKQSGKNTSVFLEEILSQKGENNYCMVSRARHKRKDVCFRLSQTAIDYIRTEALQDNVTHEMIVDAKLKQYVSSPQPLLDKIVPIAINYATTAENKVDFFENFKTLCRAFETETIGGEYTRNLRIMVGQKLEMRCIRNLTDSQIMMLEKILDDFCGSDWN